MNGFWKAGNDDEIVASVLSAELTLGDERRFARCAAAEVIGNAITTADYVDSSGDHERAQARVHLLYGSRSGDIGLVVQQHLMLRQVLGTENGRLMRPLKNDPHASTSCTTALDATREAIRKNWEYLRDANLNSTDLSQIRLYKADLARASLRATTMPGANFRCSNLFQVDLTGADWTEGHFRFANVTEAKPPDFVKFARAQGAFDSMDDATWLEWRKSGFPLDGSGGYMLTSGPAADCGQEESH